MDSHTKVHHHLASGFILSSFLFLLLVFFSTAAQATRTTAPLSLERTPTQLAFIYIGPRRGYWGPGYYGPRPVYYRPGVWRPAYPYGRQCQRSCVVDRWTGYPIRCSTRCFY